MVDYRIQTFLTLYETLNYHRAGEQLQMSQPAVSQQIHGLEREYGCKLFRYDGKRLSATKEADRVARYARAAMYNQQKMLRELQMPAAEVVRIGVTKTIGEYVVADPLCRFLREGHGDLTVTVDNTETLLHKLERGALDFALIEGAFDKDRYGFVLYRNAPFVGMCHKSHPFAGRRITLAELADQPILLREPGSGTRAILERALAERGHSLRLFSRVICASSFSLLTRFVEENLGITFAYSVVGEGRPEIATFQLDCLCKWYEFNLVYMSGAQVAPLIRSVLGKQFPLPDDMA